jgi:choline dehydrogenase-like flavoprotein
MPDEGQGVVRVDSGGRLRLEYVMTDAQRAQTRTMLKAAARLYFAAGATQVYVPTAVPLRLNSEAQLDLIDGLPLWSATAPYISAHQQGTVRFAPDARDGGAAPDGQVYGTRGVYVFDSSGFPSSASSHTMAPIITVARCLTRRLLGQA